MRSMRKMIITHVYGLRPRRAIVSPPLTPVTRDGLDLLGRQLHDSGGAARASTTGPAEGIRALHLRAAVRAVRRRRGGSRGARRGLRRRRGRLAGNRRRGRSARPRAVVEHGPALVASLRVFRHEGTADWAHEPAEHDAAAAEPEIAVRVEFQRPARIELERTPGIELQGAARSKLELPVRIEVQEVGHRPPLSPSRYPGVRPYTLCRHPAASQRTTRRSYLTT